VACEARIRFPIEGRAIIRKTVNVLVIDRLLNPVVRETVQPAVIAAAAPTNTASTQNPAKTSAIPKTAAPKTVTQPAQPRAKTVRTPETKAATQKTAEKKQSANMHGVTQGDVDEPDNVTKLVSMDVLTWEKERCAKMMATTSDADAKSDLVFRAQALDTQTMILETQVATGKLTLEGYLARLEQTIEKDKVLYNLLKKKNPENARYVAQRVLIMKKELTEAQANMEQLQNQEYED
jgi:hypothetical protein